MSAPDTQLLAYIVIAIIAANVIWLLADDEEGVFRVALSVLIGAIWPLIVSAALLFATAWAVVLPARKLEYRYLVWRENRDRQHRAR